MRIIYNGIDLMPLETHMMNIEPVYDDTGVDYLYTRFTVAVRSVVNGQLSNVSPVVSYGWDSTTIVSSGLNQRSSPVLVPPTIDPVSGVTTVPFATGMDQKIRSSLREVYVQPNAAPLTHQVIRHRLSTPRGKLYVFSGPGVDLPTGIIPTVPDPPGGRPTKTGDTNTIIPSSSTTNTVLMMLEAPIDGMVCDSNNGPKPRLLSIQAVEGDASTFIVDWACEAYYNEGPENNVNPTGALISNRFTQSHSVAEDGFTTINTQGTAIYRTDLLYSIIQSPDAQRPLLFMPILQGFTRVIDYVSGLPDVTGVKYAYTDTQVKTNFPAAVYCGAAAISAVHRQAIISNTELGASLLKLPSELHAVNEKHREEREARERRELRKKESFRHRANAILKSRKP